MHVTKIFILNQHASIKLIHTSASVIQVLFGMVKCVYLIKTFINFYYINFSHFCFQTATALNSYFEFEEKSTSGYVFYEKTFPKLKSFTLSTWLQIYNPLLKNSLNSPQNDSRTIFTYSLGNFFIQFCI